MRMCCCEGARAAATAAEMQSTHARRGAVSSAVPTLPLKTHRVHTARILSGGSIRNMHSMFFVVSGVRARTLHLIASAFQYAVALTLGTLRPLLSLDGGGRIGL